MDVDVSEVERIAGALEVLESRFAKLLQLGKMFPLSAAREEELKIQTAELKAHVKQLNKYGTIDGGKFLGSDVERIFFSKAVQAASSSFMLRANISPRNPNWVSGLTAVHGELIYYLCKLKKQYPWY